MALTFNGTTADSMGCRTRRLTPELMPAEQSSLIPVPGRPGAYLSGRSQEVRSWVWEFDYDETANDAASHAIAQWLAWPIEADLILDSDPNKTYQAKPRGRVQPDRINSTLRRASVTFVASDPLSSGTESETALVTGDNTVDVSGNTPTYPRLSLTLDGDSPFLALQHVEQNKTVLIGSPDDVENPSEWGSTWILTDDFADLTNWTAGTSADGGDVSGNIACNGYTASPNHATGSWGSGSTWHGDTLRADVADASGNALTDFTCVMRLGFYNLDAGQTGRIELYLLDASGNCIGKVALKDNSGSSPVAMFEARAGTLAAGTVFGAYTSGGWNDLGPSAGGYGILYIQRQGTHWWAEILKIAADGSSSYGYSAEWDDVDSDWTAGLKYVELHMGSYGATTPLTRAWVTRVEVIKLPGSDPVVPLIFESGKTIVVYMGEPGSTPGVYYDGNSYMRYVDLQSEWFGLDPGSNTVKVRCATGVDAAGTAYVTPRWL